MADTMTHDQLVDAFTGGLAPDDLPPFAGSDRLRPDGRPRPEFRARLRRIPNLANAGLVAVVFAYPPLVVWAAVSLDHPLSWIVAFLLMGAWFQRSLTLFHEAAHRLLFSNRRLNDFVGEQLIGWLTFGDGTAAYRKSHAQHHRDEFGPKEPDFALYARYPIPRDSLRRKLVRDAVGISGWKNLKPPLVGLFVSGRRHRALRFLSGQVLIFALFALAGHPWLYLLLWLLPWMTYWRVANRLRALAEHGGMTRSPDRRRTTHDIRQGFLAKHVFLSQAIGYHLAHHVDSGIPMANLPELHRALVEDGYVVPQLTHSGYWAFWRTLVRPAT
ncbi:MAG: fatty acid desaturase [Acidimicrobiia bacterium]|nr:fatty acid desaturase [Acidimicrobiia bacterium]MDH5238315.1 fatty acid desaturase [Acidimicrobiia bacterium]